MTLLLVLAVFLVLYLVTRAGMLAMARAVERDPTLLEDPEVRRMMGFVRRRPPRR